MYPQFESILYSNILFQIRSAFDIFFLVDLNCSGGGTSDRNGPFPQFNNRWIWIWLFWWKRLESILNKMGCAKSIQRKYFLLGGNGPSWLFSFCQIQTKCWHPLVCWVSRADQSWNWPFCWKILEVCPNFNSIKVTSILETV